MQGGYYLFHWMKVRCDQVIAHGEILIIITDANTMKFIHMNVHPYFIMNLYLIFS
jgi:hypothetical protein